MKIDLTFALGLILALAPSSPLLADWGSIPFKKGAQVSEPVQDAIIAWNGTEQLLYLQTTLGASEETRVLEVMPLPSRPVVKAAQQGIFKRVAFLMPQPAKSSGSVSDPFGGEPKPAATVVERQQIGAHDIRVVRLLDAAAFSDWIRKEVSSEDHPIEVPDALLDVIGEYAADGFSWFLFDVVDLVKEKRKKTPLQIRFATRHLYYPMRITRTETGNTEVNLAVISNVLFDRDDCIGIPREDIEVPAKPRELPANKIHFIDPPIFQLLGSPTKAMLRTWRISGAIDGFEKDLLIRHPADSRGAGSTAKP